MVTVSETRWGSPTASKTAVLLHGLTSASPSWFRVAQGLVDAGYYVIAPDLIGHGHAARPTDYSIDSFVSHLRPQLDGLSAPLDLLVGHSLGGRLAVALQLKPKRMVLLDPVLEVEAGDIEGFRKALTAEVRNPATVEQYLVDNPKWSKEDAAIKVAGAILCSPEAVEGVCDTNLPFGVTHLLPPPSTEGSSSPTEIIILGADLSLGPCFTLAEARALAKSHPEIKTAFVEGASHSIHREAVDVVLEVLLSGSVKGKGLLATEDVKA
ncbi:Alpha/Beta hydrolase protein [Leucosporidium creatinivorum]|uniref:Alpha/Beta hydrolase protein n=1 Tax=Leucosporidium creatinivorum TaxID=106004 RepID=A0A1Y2G4J7_9BASI|nr:Alpha/Beta hydrolase protein [Leucosporidium creatinivorum]